MSDDTARPERDKSSLKAAVEALAAYREAKEADNVWAALDALTRYTYASVQALNEEIIYDKRHQVPGIVADRMRAALDVLRSSEGQDHLVTKVGFMDALLAEMKKGGASTPPPRCGCGCCHYPDYGACRDYEKGMNGRCVYCDHGEQCHPGDGPLANGPLEPQRLD